MTSTAHPHATRAIAKAAACAVAAALFAGLLAAQAPAVHRPAPLPAGVIVGQVFDGTCYGPCVEGVPPRPWKGEGLTVLVRRLVDGRIVARATPEDGRFGFDLVPGRYEVEASVDGRLWVSDSKRVRVDPGEVERVRLVVSNRGIR